MLARLREQQLQQQHHSSNDALSYDSPSVARKPTMLDNLRSSFSQSPAAAEQRPPDANPMTVESPGHAIRQESLARLKSRTSGMNSLSVPSLSDNNNNTSSGQKEFQRGALGRSISAGSSSAYSKYRSAISRGGSGMSGSGMSGLPPLGPNNNNNNRISTSSPKRSFSAGSVSRDSRRGSTRMSISLESLMFPNRNSSDTRVSTMTMDSISLEESSLEWNVALDVASIPDCLQNEETEQEQQQQQQQQPLAQTEVKKSGSGGETSSKQGSSSTFLSLSSSVVAATVALKRQSTIFFQSSSPEQSLTRISDTSSLASAPIRLSHQQQQEQNEDAQEDAGGPTAFIRRSFLFGLQQQPPPPPQQQAPPPSQPQDRPSVISESLDILAACKEVDEDESSDSEENAENPYVKERNDDDHDVETCCQAHDQLPSVESLLHDKSLQKQHSFSCAQQQHWKILCLFIFMSIFFAALGFIVATSPFSSRNHPVHQNAQGNPTTSSTIPSATDDEAAAAANDKVLAFLGKIMEWGWSEPALVLDPSKPPYKAASWIVETANLADMASSPALELQQLYAVATFFFALSGPQWTYGLSFLSPDRSVCEWNAEFEGSSSGDKVLLGIICNCGGNNNTESSCDPSAITQIRLPNMGLSGSLPSEIRLLENLLELDLQQNHLTGQIPAELAELSALTRINLSRNTLSGPLPSTIGQLVHLESLVLANNSLSGVLPSAGFSAMTSLVMLNLNSNKFSGSLNSLSGVRNLQALFLEDNQLSGELTSEVSLSWPNIKVIDLSNNRLQGPLHGNLLLHPNLTILDLSHNMIDKLPEKSTYYQSNAIQYLDLHDTKIAGAISANLARWKQLEFLDASGCSLTGTIPTELAGLSKLTHLSLANNVQLEETPVPAWIGELTELQTLSLKNTNRNGVLPTELGALQQLFFLDLASNRLTGHVPDALGNAKSLRYLTLSHNGFAGEIPSNLAQLELHQLLLNDNKISGNADALCDPQMEHLNVFYGDCMPQRNAESGTIEYEFDCSCCSKCCNAASSDQSQRICDDMNDVDDNFVSSVWDHPFVREHFRWGDVDDLRPVDVTVASIKGSFPMPDLLGPPEGVTMP